MNKPIRNKHPRENHPRNKRAHGFTLVELLIVIAIIAVLIAILLPALNKARDAANSVACQSNLRQIGIGILMYASEQKSFPTYCNAPGNSLPFTTTPLSPAPIYIYWEQMLIQGGYVTTGTFDPKDTNKQWPTSGVWRCPSLTDDQVRGALGATGGGYGCTYPGLPVQFTGTPYAGGPGWTSGMFPIPPGQNPTVGWTPVLPPKPGQLTNSTVDLLVSDCGKPTGNETFVATNSIGQRPYGGYYPTDVYDTTGTNSTAGMPGLFHANRTLANICFADGHIESWTLKQLNADATMSQQANIPNLLCRPMTHSNPLPIY